MGVAQDNTSAQPIEGLRDNQPSKFALTDARVVVRPGQTIDHATVLIENTSITSVGTDVVVPPGFMTLDCAGQTIYAGLIDAYSDVEVPRTDAKASVHWNSNITPQRSAWVSASESQTDFDKLRSQGITVRVVAPRHGIIKGNSCAILTSDAAAGRRVLKQRAWQHASLTVPTKKTDSKYPNSPMGATALLRQSLHDARWYRDAWQSYRNNPTLPRPDTNQSLHELSDSVAEERFVIDTANERMALRADDIAKEFSLSVVLRGSGNEYRDVKAIAAGGHPILLPIGFAKKPRVATAADANNVTLRELMHWDLAPNNPARLVQAGATICLTTDGLKNVGDFLKQVRVAVARGLSQDDALAAVTTIPAKLLDLDATIGQVKTGQLANLLITDGDLFDKETTVLETWVAGKQFVISPAKKAVDDALVGKWTLGYSVGDETIQLVLDLVGKKEKLVGTVSVSANNMPADKVSDQELILNPANRSEETKDAEQDADENAEDTEKEDASDEKNDVNNVKLEQLVRQADRLDATVRLSDLDSDFSPGLSQLSLITVDEGDETTTVIGTIRLPDGVTKPLEIVFVGPEPSDASKEKSENDQEEEANDDRGLEHADDSLAATPVFFPLGAMGIEKPAAEPSTVIFRDATLWTCGDAGIMENGDVLIRDGKIASVGDNLPVPANCQIVDARGKHITPGLIDCHSHMATDGGVNESGQSVTAEVRIGDFIDNSDINIYRQLAGGVTTSNILHGSANPIGGQNQVIKLRWGQSMKRLRMKEAPPGIKFALGENVKRNQGRYPNTRMGVEQIIRDQLLAAREYDRAMRDYQRGKQFGLPPRRDLQLDAMAEIQRGERWIHCHSYRQDEIVATLDVLDEFGVQIGTLQHILEGYKVADRMARHGAMASSFSDWWAYKFEVFDAIPYNGALMHRQGIVVSFNSDDRELARHLNTEAAKAVKYGGVAAEEALKFVTLNPAKQLRIEKYVGSIEVGKDADLVVWSGPPLSTLTRCEQTWIDGQRYFDLASDRAMRDRDAKLHAVLVQKVIDAKSDSSAEKKSQTKEEDRWARHDVYCTATGEDGHRHDQWERRR
jgi:N-acetylglucosamine-6-phosphate deacetylase